MANPPSPATHLKSLANMNAILLARHAETGQKKGERAFYEMVRWNTGEFVIEHGLRTKRVSLEKDAMYLLMEGLRLVDEENNPAKAVS